MTRACIDCFFFSAATAGCTRVPHEANPVTGVIGYVPAWSERMEGLIVKRCGPDGHFWRGRNADVYRETRDAIAHSREATLAKVRDESEQRRRALTDLVNALAEDDLFEPQNDGHSAALKCLSIATERAAEIVGYGFSKSTRLVVASLVGQNGSAAIAELKKTIAKQHETIIARSNALAEILHALAHPALESPDDAEYAAAQSRLLDAIQVAEKVLGIERPRHDSEIERLEEEKNTLLNSFEGKAVNDGQVRDRIAAIDARLVSMKGGVH